MGVQVGDGGQQVNFFGGTHYHRGPAPAGPGNSSGTAWPTRPWRVFLSHTTELSRYPAGGSFVAAAKRAVERAEHVAVEMGSWTASSDTPEQVCRAKLETCDLYVGVFGFQYGTPIRQDPERSYTELEFDTATGLDIPRLAFLIAEDLTVPVPRDFYHDPDHGRSERQTTFRARVSDAVTVARVHSPDDLERLLYQALTERAHAGPSRHGLRDPDETDRRSWPVVWQMGRHRPGGLFVGREVELQQLRDSFGKAEPGWGAVQVLTGLGGVGKTRLAVEYAHRWAGDYPVVAWACLLVCVRGRSCR
ncbi:MAG: DUF4062 domain-containing protein [Kineosporiaceae bacterium]